MRKGAVAALSSITCSRTAVLSLLSALLAVGPLQAAEVHLRESLLQQQQNRATITITAVVDHIGHAAHSLSKDCDLHVPLRTRDIHVAVMGELKNACSIKPAGAPNTHWAHKLYDATHGRAVQVSGVFRVWLEHPPPAGAVQSEAKRVEWFKNSNPDHVVEIHPITRVGSLDFTSHVAEIGPPFEGKRVGKLSSVLKKKITVSRVSGSVFGTQAQFVKIDGKKVGFNHWDLTARVVAAATPLTDGHRIRLSILDDSGQVVSGASDLPAVTVSGTQADTGLQSLSAGDQIDFQALIRMDVGQVLSALSSTPQEINLPVEFVVLGLS